MSNQLVSLLDIAKRRGSDQEIGLLEATITYAPELSSLMGRVIPGTQYKTSFRHLPTVGFRQANNGSDTVKGRYSQVLKECFIIDAQMQADKAVVDAEAGGSGPQSDVSGVRNGLLADEAAGVIMASYITIGAQFYYGTSNDANGFVGLSSLMPNLNTTKNLTDPAPPVVGAGGTTASVQSSAYLVWEHIKGTHFIFGGNQSVTMLPEWRIQQVSGANSKPMTAYVNNLQGWIGLAVNHPSSIGRIANINLATDSKPLTDKLVAQLLSLMPLQMRAAAIAQANTGAANQWGGQLKLYMNPLTAFGLQQSRSPVSSGTGTAITSADQLRFADLPTSSNGVPIVLTDSISNTESVLT
jgi:hypothetical protein